MLNPYKNSWVFINNNDDFPELNKPVHILVEPDVIFNSDKDCPFVRRAYLICEHFINAATGEAIAGTLLIWKLLDHDPELEDDYIRQDETVVAWRYNPPFKYDGE